MELTAYIHRTCPYSKKLIHLLESSGFYEQTNIIDTYQNPFSAPGEKILSVPVLFADKNIISSGPIDESWLQSYLKLFTTIMPSNEELFRAFISAVLDNVSTATYIYLYPENVNIILQQKDYFLSTSGLFRIVRKNNSEIINAVYQSTNKNLESFIEKKDYLFLKVIATNYLREKFWLKDKIPSAVKFENDNELDFLSHWLFTRAASGRIGINHHHNHDLTLKKTQKILNYIVQHLDELNQIVEKSSKE